MANDGKVNLELLNQGFFDAQTKINDVLMNKSKQVPSLWRDKISRGVFQYGEGYTKKHRRFYGGIPLQDSSRVWEAMQPSRSPDPSTGDPGYDACRYQSPVIGYGLEEKQYTIYQTTRRTQDICLTDILFKWQFRQQLSLMFKMLSDITLGEWENWTREQYIDHCTVVLANSALGEISIPYGADTVNMAGVDLGSIGELSQTMLDNLYMYMYRQSSGARLGTEMNMPVFGLVTSSETQKELVTKDATAREEFLYGNPNFLIEGIGGTKTYKHFAHIPDPQSVRFTIDPTNPTVLKRVWPYKEEPTTIGDAIKVDPLYVDAPFELSVIFLKDVFRTLVPPTNPSNLDTRDFMAVPNMGEFMWLNIQDREDNPLKEKGYYFARFRAAPEPMEYCDEAIAILHRRCKVLDVRICDLGADNATTATDILSISNYDSEGTSNTQIEVLLASSINSSIGDSVTITEGDGSTTHTGYIVDDSGDATYRIDLGAADPDEDWAASILAGGSTPTVTSI